MGRHSFRKASENDNSSINGILYENSSEGDISLRLETKPSFFDAMSVKGDFQVFVSENEGSVTGVSVKSNREAYINGNVEKIGYLGNLFLSKRHRGGRIFYDSMVFLSKLMNEESIPFYLISISENNTIALNFFGKNRLKYKSHSFLEDYQTFSIKPRKFKPNNEVEVIRGNSSLTSTIIDFLQTEGKHKQLFPHYSIDDFSNGILRDLSPSDFYLAFDNKKVVGMVAKWNQSGFKQRRVSSYSKSMKIKKPLINMISKISSYPRLPKEGGLLNSFYMSFPLVKEDSEEIASALIRNILSDNSNYDYAISGVFKSDPLTKVFKKLNPVVMGYKIYGVSNNDYDFSKLKTSKKYLDVGNM